MPSFERLSTLSDDVLSHFNYRQALSYAIPSSLKAKEVHAREKSGLRWYLNDVTYNDGRNTVRSTKLYRGEGDRLVKLGLIRAEEVIDMQGPGVRDFMGENLDPSDEFVRGLGIIAEFGSDYVTPLTPREIVGKQIGKMGRTTSARVGRR